MWKINEIIAGRRKPKANLTAKMKDQFVLWAMEAHKIDQSRSVSHYYKMYVDKLREKYRELDDKQKFYDEGIIEV